MMWWFQISKHCQTPYKESEKNTSVLLFLLSSLVLSATHCLITDKQIFFLERPGKGLGQESAMNLVIWHKTTFESPLMIWMLMILKS